jgi:hypothetical protein
MCSAERFVVKEKFISAKASRLKPATSFSCKTLAVSGEILTAQKKEKNYSYQKVINTSLYLLKIKIC